MTRYADLDTDVLGRVIQRYEKVLKDKRKLLERVEAGSPRWIRLARDAEAYRKLLEEAREELNGRAEPS